MNIQNKKNELISQFEVAKKELDAFTREAQSRQKLLQDLQAKYQLLEELEKESEKVSKPKK
jgi:hypothetical protein